MNLLGLLPLVGNPGKGMADLSIAFFIFADNINNI
jgi:hypothetical protein